MKWIRWTAVPIAVFLGALVLFATMPRSSLIRMLDIAEFSLDSVTTLVRPAADRTGDRADRAAGAARRHSASWRAEAFRADVSGVARVLDGDTIEVESIARGPRVVKPGAPPTVTVAAATSRETSAAPAGHASTTFREILDTQRPASAPDMASGGSAPKPKRGQRAGDEQSGDSVGTDGEFDRLDSAVAA